MGNTWTSCIYEIDGDPEAFRAEVPDFAIERFGVPGKPLQVRLSANDSELAIERGDSFVAQVDLNTGRRTLVDHARREYAVLDHGAEALRILHEDGPRFDPGGGLPAVQVELARQTWTAPGFVIHAPDVQIDVHTLASTALPHRLNARVLRLFWDALLVGAPDSLTEGRVPVSIVVRSGSGAVQMSARLIGLERGECIPTPKIPEDYSDATGLPGNRRPGPDHEPAGADDRSARLRRAEAERLARRERLRHSLRSSGQDFALVAKQPLLDVARDMVNEAAVALDEFESDDQGTNGGLRLVLDWWPQVESAMTLSDTDRAAFLAQLSELLLMDRVRRGEPIAGMTQAEEATYASQVLTQADMARILVFSLTFPAPRRTAWADLLLSDLTQTRYLDLGEVEVEHSMKMIVFRAWDFGMHIGLHGKPLLHELSFQQDAVRSVLAVDELTTTFLFSTVPTGSLSNVLTAIFTLGISALVETNFGPGYAKVSDARIVVDWSAQSLGHGYQWAPVIDAGASSMDAIAFLGSVNPISQFAVIVAGLIVSATGKLNGPLFDALQDELTKLGQTPLLFWPEIWRAVAAPPGVASAALLDPGRAFLEGELANDSGLAPGAALQVFDSPVQQVGYVLSARYLTAWVREQLGALSSYQNQSASAWASSLGVKLPDPKSIIGVGHGTGGDGPRDNRPKSTEFEGLIENCEEPAVQAPLFENRAMLTRTAPVVMLPPEGSTTTAGRLEFSYQLRLEAVRYDTVNSAWVVPQHCESPMGSEYSLGGGRLWRTTPKARALGQLSHAGLPRATTPGELLQRLEAVERWKEMHGADAVGGGGWTDPVDGPGGPPFGGDGGGQPGVAGGFGGPGGAGGPGGSFGDAICEPAHCEWRTQVKDAVLATYLDARWTASVDLTLGFTAEEVMLVPEIALHRVDQDPQLAKQDLDTNGPLTAVDAQTIEAFIIERIQADLQAQLQLAFGGPAPLLERGLLELGIGQHLVPQELQDILRFRQSGSTGGFAAEVKGEMLYWPVSIVQGVSTTLF